MAFDPMYETTGEDLFVVVGRYLYEWEDFSPNYQEIMPRHIPKALGKYVVFKDYVDANHAENMENRRSRSGKIIYFNDAPIIRYSKPQIIVEASIFG